MTASSEPSGESEAKTSGMAESATWLRGHFLVAMPGMSDPRFARSLIYLCEHSDQGAMGIVVNKPTDMTLASLFERVELANNPDPELAGQPVLFGGPVQLDRAFVLHKPAKPWQATMKITDDIALTSSKDILESVGRETAPQSILVALGYAGWVPGQLDSEILRNDWLTVPADDGILFDLPYEERLPAALAKLGIGFDRLSDVAGHA
jgi:putative transcriptional regulator